MLELGREFGGQRGKRIVDLDWVENAEATYNARYVLLLNHKAATVVKRGAL